MPSMYPYAEAPEKRELRAFISGSDREPDEKDKVARIIEKVNTQLVDEDFEVRIVRWRTQASLDLSDPTNKKDIFDKLSKSHFFIGIASSRFNWYTALEWRIAFSRYTNPNCEPMFEKGTVYFLTHNEIVERLEIRDEKEEELKELPIKRKNYFRWLLTKFARQIGFRKTRGGAAARFRRFYRKLSRKKASGDIQYYQCRSYSTDREDSEDHLDNILNFKLFARIYRWFMENYPPAKATEPTLVPDMRLPLGEN